MQQLSALLFDSIKLNGHSLVFIQLSYLQCYLKIKIGLFVLQQLSALLFNSKKLNGHSLAFVEMTDNWVLLLPLQPVTLLNARFVYVSSYTVPL